MRHPSIERRPGPASRSGPEADGEGSGPAPFRPAWWLPGGHLQTLWPVFFRRRRPPPYRTIRMDLEDGDFLDLDWVEGAPEDAPVVLLLHGLEGGRGSHYIPGLMRALRGIGMQPVLMHLRGCSGEPNRRPRRYTAGSTGDLVRVLDHICRVRPGTPVAAVGFSLGANILLKHLGEAGGSTPLSGGVAVSPPFLLERAAERLERGLSRLYRQHLLGALKRAIREKHSRFPEQQTLSLRELDRIRTFRAFDHAVTAPLHGYGGVADYYTRASCRSYLAGIRVPTLVLHSTDDPFTSPDAVPRTGELPPSVHPEIYRRGGHVAFVAGRVPGWGRYWLEERIPAFLRDLLAGRTGSGTL